MLRIEWRRGAILLLTVACNQPSVQPPKNPAAPVPQISATVVTIRTTFQPENKTTSSTIVIGDEAARATAEVGTWRRFDFKKNRVAFVNDFAKTYRYESMESLMQRRAVAAEQPVGENVPRAEYAVTGVRRPVLGVEATQAVVKLGGYQRQLWFAEHPLIPERLFALMQASRTPTADAAMAKDVDEALLALRGFPLLEHAEVPYANTKIVIDRDVVSVVRRNVDKSLLQIPGDYRQLKPLPPGPVVRPRRVVEPPAPAPVTTAPPATSTVPTETAATTTVIPPVTETTTSTEPKPAEVKPEQKKPPAKPKPPATRKKPATTKAKAPATKKKAPAVKPKAKAPASRHPASS